MAENININDKKSNSDCGKSECGCKSVPEGKFDEKERLTDVLSSQKFITGVYNTFLCETSTEEVKNCMASILDDEHRIQEEIFDILSTKGWYKTEKAEQTKINETLMKFSAQ